MRDKLQAAFVTKSDNVLVQMIRYGMVAVVALAVDFGIYAALVTNNGSHPVFAATCGFVAGIIVNYAMSIKWVFSQRMRTRRVEIISFLIIGLIGLGLTNLIVWTVALHWHQNDLLAKLIAVMIVFFWNFGARKWLLFNKSIEEQE